MREMTESQKSSCKAIIHTASVAAGGVGLSPIPGSDAPVIIAAQITMIIGLGKVFDVPISTSYARGLAEAAIAKQLGKMAAGQLAKLIPGLGSVINAGIAATFTETFGWDIAKQFHREYLERNGLA